MATPTPPRPLRPLPGRRRGRRVGLLWGVVGLLVLALVVGSPAVTHFLVTLWWFGEMGYVRVFTTEVIASWLLTVVGVVIAFGVMRLFCGAVARIARGAGRGDRYTSTARGVLNIVLLVLAILLSQGLSSSWTQVGLFFTAVPFHTQDPVLHADISFYVFALPIYESVLGWLGTVLAATLIAALVLLYTLDLSGRVRNVLAPDGSGYGEVPPANGAQGPVFPFTAGMARRPGSPAFDMRSLRPYVSVLSLWLALVALLIAASSWLSRYDTLIQPSSPHLFGAGYVATHAIIPSLSVLALLSVVAAVILLANALRARSAATLAVVPLAWLAAWAVLTILIPGAVNLFVVRPAELQAERPYIANNIAGTRAGFGLGTVASYDFPASPLPADVVQRSHATIASLRVLDASPFLTSSKQKQEIRSYYDFALAGADTDHYANIDRYRVGGTLRQVLLAAREINTSQLPDTAQTWQNLNLTYTHGYGIVMSPVNHVDADGSPLYWIKDIPPQPNRAAGPEVLDLPRITRPEIYFGTETNNSVFVDTRAPEFDRAVGDQEYYGHYTGSAGITLGSFLKRLVWISYFNSPVQVGTSTYLSSNSRVLLYRNVSDRVSRIAPFFSYDPDPYITLDDHGHLWWLLDGYTSSITYPYSEPFGDQGWNYLRNSVKVAVDAYNGTVRFYLADPTDPIARAYGRLFPGLLQPLSAMPADLRRHIRVPQTLFDIQSAVYTKYHMSDPQIFYNQEDKWDLPAVAQQNGGGQGGNQAQMESYYTVMEPLGAHAEEFVLVRPFLPLSKKNMIALLVARCDGPHYGQLVLYRFPIGTQVLGPTQFTAAINQTPAISEKVSLWGQQGSTVQWGNVIVVPLGQGLLYMQPLYLQAANSPIPQLQRVIVYANGQLAWGTTLDAALNQVFHTAAGSGQTAGTAGTGGAAAVGGSLAGPARSVLVAIDAHLRAAQRALAGGDYLTYGREMDIVQRLVRSALSGQGTGASRK